MEHFQALSRVSCFFFLHVVEIQSYVYFLYVRVRSCENLGKRYRRLDKRFCLLISCKKKGEKIEKEKWFGSVPAVALVRRPRPPPIIPGFCSASLLLLAFLLQRTLRNADFIPSSLSTRTNSKQLGRYHSAVFCATPERNGQDAASIGVAFSTAAPNPDPSASSNTNRTAYSASRLQTPLQPPDGRAT